MALSSFFFVAAALILPVASEFGEKSQEALGVQSLAVVLWDLSLVAIVYWRVSKHGGTWKDLGLRGPWQDGSWSPARIGRNVLLAYAAAIGCVLVYSTILNATGLDDLLPSQQIPEEYFDHAWLVALIGCSVVITAPVAEELFFRGFMYAGLRGRMSILVAALTSGFVFSLAHTDPGLIVPFTLVGAILAYTYERTGSIYANMSVHFIFNAISFLILVLVPDARTS